MRSLVLVLFLCPAAGAQTLVDYTAAAAGGSVGTVAGKKLSDGLDKVMGRATQQLERAGSQGSPSQKTAAAEMKSAAAEIRALEPAVTRENPAASPRRRRAEVAVRFVGPTLPPVTEPAKEPEAAPPAPPVPPEPTAEELAAVGEGTTREELLVKMGPPASRIAMADEGRLSETYYFRLRGGGMARVRLSDGAVASVEGPAAR